VFALLNRIPGLAPLGLRIGHVPEGRLTFSEPHCVPEVRHISGAGARCTGDHTTDGRSVVQQLLNGMVRRLYPASSWV